MTGQEKLREKFSRLLMTTQSALESGSIPLLKLLIPPKALEEFLGLAPFLKNFEGTGTYSLLDSSSFCMINFFVMENNICLDIYADQGLGRQELVTKSAPTKERSIFSKLAICLLGLTFLTVFVVLTLLTRA